LIEEQMKILKAVNEMTTRTDMNEFAKKIGLTPAQIMQQMQELSCVGYLKKVGGGFAITEKGKNAIKSVTLLSENLKFQFYLGLGEPTDFLAKTVKEFFDDTLKVDAKSLEFHVYRGDFENWFRTAVSDLAFADELAKIKKKNLKGEELRKALTAALEQRYGP
jgi:hypothetical protein